MQKSKKTKKQKQQTEPLQLQQPELIDQLQFCQVNDDIPYKRIQTLKICNVTEENINMEIKYKIQIDDKIQEKHKSSNLTVLIRSASDFEWLFNKLQQCYSDRFIIIPLLNFDYKWQNLLPSFITKLAKTELSKKQEVYHKQYLQKMLFRFLDILSKISLNFFYWKPKEFSTPLFIFISSNDNFDFYKKLIERKKNQSNQSAGYAGSTQINNILSGLLNKGKTIFNYIPIYSKNNGQTGGLSDLRKEAQIIYRQGEKLMQRLKSYKIHIENLHQNFVKYRQQLKKRTSILLTLIFRLNNQIKHVKLVFDEIQSVTKKYQLFSSKQTKQKQEYMEKQLMQYKQFTLIQLNQITNCIKKIGIQFIETNVLKDKTTLIQIGSLYENYRFQKEQMKEEESSHSIE